MALLLAGLFDLTPQELPGLMRARGNPAGQKSLHGKTSDLRDYPQAAALYQRLSARIIGRLIMMPDNAHIERIKSSMMPP